MAHPSELPPVPWPQQWTWPKTQGLPPLLITLVFGGLGVYGLVTGYPAVFAFGLVVVFIAFALWWNGRGSNVAPTLVNAVTLTEADVLPPDSWVHLFRERRRSWTLVVVFAMFGIICTGVGVIVWVVKPVDDQNPLLLRIVGTGIGLFGLLFIYGAVRTAIGRKRLGSFGERPLGFAVGPSALSLVTVSGVRYIPWESITRVKPQQSGSRTSLSKNNESLMLLVISRSVDENSLDEYLAPLNFAAHPWTTFATIYLAATNSGFRESLGTANAQEMFDNWTAALTKAKKPHN